MIAVLGLLVAIPGTILAGLGLYVLTLAVAAAIGGARPKVQAAGLATKRLVVLVPAHDEEQLVARAIHSLLNQSYPRGLYRVVVVADNCTDGTATAAVAAGAEVMHRAEPEAPGKGRALRWAMDRLLAGARFDAVVVVDADSIADPGLLAALAARFDAGAEVVQAEYSLMADDQGRRSDLSRAGFLLFHRVRFAGRDRLGLPANLVGNGMLISRRVLEAHPWDAFIGAEDLEYSMRLRLEGVRPRFAADAHVSGPGSASPDGAMRQRLRWEGGRFHVVRKMLPLLVAKAIRGRDPGLLDAALDLATPPLGLLALSLAAGLALTAFAAALHVVPAWALAPWIAGIAAVAAFVAVGLAAAGEPALIWTVLRGAPRFAGWKLMAYLRLLRGFDVNRWDRTDRVAVDAGRVEIAGVPVDPVDMPAAMTRLRMAVGGPRLFQVSTINLDFLVRAQSDPAVRRIFQRSDLNLADGAPVVWLGRLLGARIPERVAGADLVPALLEESARTGARVFFLGGEGGVAQIAADRLVKRHPGLVVAGTYEPPRAAVEAMNNGEILERIAEARADVLLVAFGHPKQERWIDLHRDQLTVSVAIGVGCVLDIIAGRSSRAPRWMQAAGLEWAYRLAREPRRLVGRYATDAVWLIPIAARALGARFAGALRAAEAA